MLDRLAEGFRVRVVDDMQSISYLNQGPPAGSTGDADLRHDRARAAARLALAVQHLYGLGLCRVIADGQAMVTRTGHDLVITGALDVNLGQCAVDMRGAAPFAMRARPVPHIGALLDVVARGVMPRHMQAETDGQSHSYAIANGRLSDGAGTLPGLLDALRAGRDARYTLSPWVGDVPQTDCALLAAFAGQGDDILVDPLGWPGLGPVTSAQGLLHVVQIAAELRGLAGADGFGEVALFGADRRLRRVAALRHGSSVSVSAPQNGVGPLGRYG